MHWFYLMVAKQFLTLQMLQKNNFLIAAYHWKQQKKYKISLETINNVNFVKNHSI